MGTVYVDFDGTLIEGDIEKKFVSWLHQRKKLNPYHYALAAITIPLNYIRKKMHRSNLIKSWTFGRTQDEIDQLCKEFLDEMAGTIILRQPIWDILYKYKNSGDKLVIITGSMTELVRSFLCKKNKLDLFDDIIGSKMFCFGFICKRHPYGKDKCLYINKSVQSVGIANEYADVYYLNLCKHVYYTGNDYNLDIVAKKNGWEKI